jgi:hypothetical protein
MGSQPVRGQHADPAHIWQDPEEAQDAAEVPAVPEAAQEEVEKAVLIARQSSIVTLGDDQSQDSARVPLAHWSFFIVLVCYFGILTIALMYMLFTVIWSGLQRKGF